MNEKVKNLLAWMRGADLAVASPKARERDPGRPIAGTRKVDYRRSDRDDRLTETGTVTTYTQTRTDVEQRGQVVSVVPESDGSIGLRFGGYGSDYWYSAELTAPQARHLANLLTAAADAYPEAGLAGG